MSFFLGVAETISRFFPNLKIKLLYSRRKESPREYIANALKKTLIFFCSLALVSLLVMLIFDLDQYLLVVGLPIVISGIFFLQLIMLPTLAANKHIKNLEKNLLPALQSVYIQINSGIPLFEILINISQSDYGEVSSEFSDVVKKINAGTPQIEALEEITLRNPSVFFRRAIWQLINGMKSGADISSIIEQSMVILSEERIIQIQNYGSRLNPISMFYMLVGVILPALSITFMILFISIINLTAGTAQLLFFGFYAMILLSQFVIMGLITTRRPSLL
jgi:flagellar protein FlaJ